MVEDMTNQTNRAAVARRMEAGRHPHRKQLDKLIKALLGVLRKDKQVEKIVEDAAAEYAEDRDPECDDLMGVDGDEDGMYGWSENPDIEGDELYERHEGDWIMVPGKLLRKVRKVDDLVEKYTALHGDEDEALEEIDEAVSEIYFSRILKFVEGDAIEEVYDEIRDNCADSAAEARDPYGYRGLSQSDFLASEMAANAARRWMRAKDHDIPKKVEEKAKEVEKGNPSYDDAKVWATAWSIYCKHIEPGSDHCSKKPGEYLKKKAGDEIDEGTGYEVSSEGWVITLGDAIAKANPRLPGGVKADKGRMRGAIELSHPEYYTFMYATPYMNERGDSGISVMMDSDSPWDPDDFWDHSIKWTGNIRKDVTTWTKQVSRDLKGILKQTPKWGSGKTAGADRELLKDWAEHVQKNRRRWEGRKYDADDWYDEALEFAESYWKFHNLDPWDDIPKREVERYAEDNAADMLTHVNAPGSASVRSAARVAKRHLA